MPKALRWPLSALLTWVAAWALALALRAVQAPLWASLGLPVVLGALVTWLPGVAATPWRRVFVAAGFPLSLLAMGQGAGLPAWLWLAPLALLLLAYPVHAWRDAPVFPTPPGALRELPTRAPLSAAAGRKPLVLDAGCGMGDGLIALRQAYPHAELHGIEWSRLWRWVALWRCPWAHVQRGDMWAPSWSGYDLVYVFQRPESMARAFDKASREMRAGSWLVSLEFAVCDAQGQPLAPHAQLLLPGGRPIWVYRLAGARSV
jgi:SAM-dependent methyltransferase